MNHAEVVDALRNGSGMGDWPVRMVWQKKGDVVKYTGPIGVVSNDMVSATGCYWAWQGSHLSAYVYSERF